MNVAFIPVRGGSKSIPLKNIKILCGQPLIYWTVRAACLSRNIDKVFVATDSDKIKDTVASFCEEDSMMLKKVVLVERSAETASDTASTESAMLEFAQNYEFDNIMLIQATSPLLSYADIDKAFEKYNQCNTDSVISVVRQKRFNWEEDSEGYVHPTNYDVFNRPRRQEFEGYLVENGAFYLTSRTLLLKTNNRVSGKIAAVEMDESSYFEIDEPSDWIIIEDLLRMREQSTKHCEWSGIKVFLTDCDGCLTDGGMYYSELGDELKKFNTRDGVGFSLLQKAKIKTGLITSESVLLNIRRAEKMKLDFVQVGCEDKLVVVKKICQQLGCTLQDVAYLGDDINDKQVMENVGLSFCPADAVDEVKNVAKVICKRNGGQGVVREIAEQLTK